ncbi:Bacterial ribonuclease P protein [Beggiatoa sp. PS]|nr:Bacterial ribonuclease P protein [Beggiatoa sp. PS]
MNPSYKFTRQQHLLTAAEYKYVFNKPYKSADRYLTVLARLNAQDVARLGLAITKKRAKLAVDRNRIKRLIRESFRHHQSDLVGLDCVVLAKGGTKTTDNRTLLQSLAKHWQNLSILAPLSISPPDERES